MSRKIVLAAALLAGFSLAVYLLVSGLVYGIGFPLDDAWIHQGYARNLAHAGQWAFLPGQPSAGSTSPLWSAILAPGHLVGINPVLWAHLLGWLTLGGLAILGYLGLKTFAPGREGWALAAGGALAFEWHLVWAAGSGMETLVHSLVITGLLVNLARRRRSWPAMGALAGLSAWLRPDGITMLGPVIFAGVLDRDDDRSPLRRLGTAALGFTLVFAPYLLFTRSFSGEWWPNTFYAKQAEYAILAEAPYYERYVRQIMLPLVGVGAVLLPGAGVFAWQAWRERDFARLAGVIWWLGYVALYAWRLPVTYQHGRYLIPTIPIWVIWGFAGMSMSSPLRPTSIWRRVLGRSWMLSAVIVLLAFWGLGANAYARDVAFIESEMVSVARWLADHTGPDARLAVHDIGAIGYFSQRPLLDLAGLVSPEVIPFIRDEGRLADYLDRNAADYLVTFPGWYPELVAGAAPVFQTQGNFGPENMAVYRWPTSPR